MLYTVVRLKLCFALAGCGSRSRQLRGKHGSDGNGFQDWWGLLATRASKEKLLSVYSGMDTTEMITSRDQKDEDACAKSANRLDEERVTWSVNLLWVVLGFIKSIDPDWGESVSACFVCQVMIGLLYSDMPWFRRLKRQAMFENYFWCQNKYLKAESQTKEGQSIPSPAGAWIVCMDKCLKAQWKL